MSCKNKCCGGSPGIGNKWYVGNPKTLDKCPNKGDYLLDPNTGKIYIYKCDEWVYTCTKLNPFDCKDVYNCLKTLPKVDNCHGKCSATMVLTDSNAVFCCNNKHDNCHKECKKPITITALVIAGEPQQPLPSGSFTNPTQLGELLETVGWTWKKAFDAYVYLVQLDITNPINDSQSYISFSNGQSINLHLECFCPNINECLPCTQNTDMNMKVLTLNQNECKLLWVDPNCLGITGVHGPTGPTGPPGPPGPTGVCTVEVITEKLNEIPCVPETDFRYDGIIDNVCLDFLVDITSTYSIATALNSPADIVSGPFAFSNNIEYQEALALLHITINGNIMSVSDSPSPINVVYYFNDLGKVIANINLFPVKCCPTGIDETYQVLARASPTGPNCPTGPIGPTATNIVWVPGNCLANCEIDIEKEICKLEKFKKYKCCLKFDTAAPYIGNNKQLNPTPWKITEFIIFGENVGADYSAEFYNYIDLGNILVANGWEQINGSSIYQYCQSQDVEFPVTTSSIKIINANSILCYCATAEDSNTNPDPNPDPNPDNNGFTVECINELDHPIKLIYVTSGCNLMIGGPEIILDCIDECADLKFYAQNLFLIECVLTSLKQANIDSPWKLATLIINGYSQTVLNTPFSTGEELGHILLNMGWALEKINVYSITQIIDEPNMNSYVTIKNGTSTDPADELTIELNVQLKSACTNGATGCYPPCDAKSSCDPCDSSLPLPLANPISSPFMPNTNCLVYDDPNCQTFDESTRLVLTKDEDGKYCWISPKCIRQEPIKILTCCTGCAIDTIPDCPFEPKYDIELTLRSCHIELIELHFGNAGPYWIVGYTIDDPPFNSILPVNKNIDAPLSLKTVAQALTELDPAWTSNPPVASIDNTTEEVKMTITGVCYKIIGLLINKQGQNNSFNYSIAVNQTTEQPCPGIPDESKLLLKTNNGFCFIDVDCLVPKLPPPFDLNKELNELGECLDKPSYKIIIYLDDCDIEKLKDTFGITVILEILSYQLVNDTIIPLNQAIGMDPTMDDLLQAFKAIGWTVDTVDPLERPVQLSITTEDLIQYIAINQVNSSPLFPPYSYLIPANFIQETNCPSQDPVNMTLIRKPDGNICWSPICPTQCIMGPIGPPGPPGPETIISAENLGGGSQVFAGISGSTIQLRTLVSGENITTQTVGNTVELLVPNNFDWGDTTFSGIPGAKVQATSSLTFNNGAILKTNVIEETTANNGVVIDTSNGGTIADAVIVKDGGIKFSNKLDPQNLTTRPLFLEYFDFGSIDIAWSAKPSNVFLETMAVKYQRIGNVVTLFIPPFALVHSSPGILLNLIVGEFVTATLLPQNDKNFIYVYLDFVSGQSIPTSLIIKSNGQIIISANLNGQSFQTGLFNGTTSSLSATYTIA